MEPDYFRQSRSPQTLSYPPNLPSIDSLLRTIDRSNGPPMPPAPQTPYTTYTPGSPNANAAIVHFIQSPDEPWSAHIQRSKHPLSISSTRHYPRRLDYSPRPSPINEFSDLLRPVPYSFGQRGGNRSGHTSPLMSPTSERTYSFQDSISNINDSEVNTEVCSESDYTGGVGDTLSQAGSSISQMCPRQFTCGTCGSTFKCDSLLRKHKMKHTKPFTCLLQGCKRSTQGFTSANDRDRHMNSVHKKNCGRDAIGYDCMYGMCRGNGKIFWRLDNFRNHLKKKHIPKEGEVDDFIKSAESQCRRVIPSGAESAMDTQSEPGCSMPLTPMESPGPSMSEDFHQAKRPRLRPPVPPFSSSWSDSDGRGTLPISPVSRGPGPDPLPNPDDRMDLDDTPAPTGSTAATPHPQSSVTERTNGPSNDKVLSRTYSAPIERLGQTEVGNRRDPAREKERLQRLSELQQKIEDYPKILDEYHDLRREQLEECGGNWPQYDYSNIGGSEVSARTMSASKYRSSPRFQRSHSKDRSVEHELSGIGENDQDRTEAERSQTSRNNSHAIQQYVGQKPTDESPVSRFICQESVTSVAAMPTTQAENKSALISPPVSVTSPHETSQKRPDVLPASTQPAHPVTLHNEKNIPCKECGKTFAMQSKLKKHMKRHSRPYACTYRGCGKFFGSKNDWKRHENSQHFQLELWKCGVISQGSTSICGKHSFRRESHITHLRKVHSITSKSDIADRAKEAHIGRNNFKSFWCGFCESNPGHDYPRGRVVPLTKNGLDGWDERFDHLGRHFTEDNFGIDRYVFEDDSEGSPDASSGEDDETGTEPVKQTQPIRSEDVVLDDLGNDINPVNGRPRVVEFTAPNGPKERLAKKVPTAQNQRGFEKSNYNWYCCKGNRGGGQCSGPNSKTLYESCVDCGHERCPNCKWEEAFAGEDVPSVKTHTKRGINT